MKSFYSTNSNHFFSSMYLVNNDPQILNFLKAIQPLFVNNTTPRNTFRNYSLRIQHSKVQHFKKELVQDDYSFFVCIKGDKHL